MSVTTDRPWSPVYARLTEADVVRALQTASIRQLARAIDEGAFKADHGPDGFICPFCTRWAAEVTSEALWMCSACGRVSTRMALQRLVSEDAFACVRLARQVLGEKAL